MVSGAAPKKVLNLKRRNPTLDILSGKLGARIVGQPEATRVLVDIVAGHLSGLGAEGRPAGNALFLGPTGTGKTRTVEALAEGLLGDPRAMIKIDCAEFQHSHEIAKLIGSPPGYLGHRETPPLLTQKALDAWHTPAFKLSIVLFDEIEKASDALWQLLLGILDKATLTLGDNQKVDFSNTIIVLTSNLGGKDIQNLLTGDGIGFNPPNPHMADDNKNASIALEKAKKHFTPEFMNRIDHTVVFKTLTKEEIRQIMEIELGIIQSIMYTRATFVYKLTDAAKDKIMEEGYSQEYGARELKRVIERRVRTPLAHLVASKEINIGDYVYIDEVGEEQFEFSQANPWISFKVQQEDILEEGKS